MRMLFTVLAGPCQAVVFRHVAGDYSPIDMTGDVVRVEESGDTFVVAVQVAEIHVN